MKRVVEARYVSAVVKLTGPTIADRRYLEKRLHKSEKQRRQPRNKGRFRPLRFHKKKRELCRVERENRLQGVKQPVHRDRFREVRFEARAHAAVDVGIHRRRTDGDDRYVLDGFTLA